MTKQYNQLIHCPECGVEITHESSFGRWIRNNPLLDSGIGYNVSDQDYWILKYKIDGTREMNLLMFIEIKTFGAKITPTQQTLLHFVNQITRNRHNINKKHQRSERRDFLVWSVMQKKEILLRCYGMHSLTFSHRGPEDSDHIFWDKKEINLDQLTSILQFNTDPDTFGPLSFKLHHVKKELTESTMTPLGFERTKTFIMQK